MRFLKVQYGNTIQYKIYWNTFIQYNLCEYVRESDVAILKIKYLFDIQKYIMPPQHSRKMGV